MPPAAERQPLPIRFKLARRFYEVIFLDAALRKIGDADPSGRQHESNGLDDNTDNAEEAFHCFVNRLAHICDNELYGGTVSAVAVLEECDCKHYIIGSNRRDDAKINDVRTYVEQLMEIVRSFSDPTSKKGNLRDLLFSHIMNFNRVRVKHYAHKLALNLENCIENHERRHPVGSEESPIDPELRLRAQLTALLGMAQFQKDEQAGRQELPFLAQCETLLERVHQLDHDVEFKDGISQQAQDGQRFPREEWIEFKHYLGRLRSYRLSIDTIIRMGRRFPDLFHETRITVIPSARPHSSVLLNIKGKTTADGILGRMLQRDEVGLWKDRVAKLQFLKLDEAIAKQISAKDNSLTVHAEILVLNWILGYMSRGEEPIGFWKGWRYIGSSKPTCRLCDYYMAAHPSRVKVRKSHGTLYPSWRVPDVFSVAEIEPRDLLLNQIVRRVRQDVLQVIESRQRLGRAHDSNSNSQLPEWLKQTESSVHSLETRFSELDISSQRGGVSLRPTTIGDGASRP